MSRHERRTRLAGSVRCGFRSQLFLLCIRTDTLELFGVIGPATSGAFPPVAFTSDAAEHAEHVMALLRLKGQATTWRTWFISAARSYPSTVLYDLWQGTAAHDPRHVLAALRGRAK